MIPLILIPLGVVLTFTVWGLLTSRWTLWTLPLILIIGYVAYACFDGSWLILQEVSK